MSIPPPVPLLDPLLENFEMFRVRHCRVTSLASGMLRMMSEGHTLCARPRPVNADNPTWIGEAPDQAMSHTGVLSDREKTAHRSGDFAGDLRALLCRFQ